MKRILSLLIIASILSSLLPQKAIALGNVTKISDTTNDSLFPVVVADNQGYLHMAWQEYSGSFEQNPGIFYSKWNGDTWSSPTNISGNSGYADNIHLTTDSSRNVHFVWNDDSGTVDHLPNVLYRTRSEAGSLSSIETLALPAGTFAIRNANVAIDGSGNPNVVYTAINDTSASVYWTVKSSGVWSAPVLVSKNASDVNLTASHFSQLRSDLSGNLYLTYWDNSAGIFYRKYSTGAWNSPFAVVSGAAEFVRMAVTPSGEVFVTWRSNSDTSIMVRWTQSGGTWQSAVALSSNAARSDWGFPIMGVTTDSQNRAHVGWGESEGGLLDLKYRSFVGGIWQTARDVDLDNQAADSPFVFPDQWDNQHFAWSEKNVSTGKWEILYRVAEGTIQTVGTSGGTVTSNPFSTNQATLTIPNGALSSSTEIGIQVGPLPANVNQSVVTIPKAYTFRPDGLVFNTPSTVRIFYTSAEAAGTDESLLQPWLWDSQSGTYTAQTVTNRSVAQNWMEVSLSHFSLYGIAAPRVIVTWDEPILSGSGKKLKYSFNLSYADDSKFRNLKDKKDDLTLNLINSSGNTVVRLEFKDKFGPKQGKNGDFSGEIDLNKTNVPAGNYTLEMLLNGSLIDTQNVSY